MRTAISDLELLEPRSVSHALEILRSHPGIVPMAGCTDIYVDLNFGSLNARRFLNLWRLGPTSLGRIELKKGLLSVGALATYTEIQRSTLVRKWIPMLADAARVVGGVQIQNRGTLGGNIANGSPAGDTLPVLAAADAVVVLGSLNGVRRVRFNEFYTGYRKSVMRPDEIILAAEIPPLAGKQWFRKVGTRAAQAISKVVMACVRDPHPRIAVGSVGPTVIRLSRTEDVLARGGSMEEAQEALFSEIQPMDDLRSTAEYRRRAAANLLASWWRAP